MAFLINFNAEALSRVFVTRLQYLTFVINRAPKVVSLTTDLHKDLVQVPLPLRTLLHALRSTFADLLREVSAEAIQPVADQFMTKSMPRSRSRSSTFRKHSRDRMFIITASWIIFGRCFEVSK